MKVKLSNTVLIMFLLELSKC